MNRASITGAGTDRCALVLGEPQCRCAAAADRLTDPQLVDRADDKFRWCQRLGPRAREAAMSGLDQLLDHARRDRPPVLLGELLRTAVMMRIVGEDPADAPAAAELIREYTGLAEQDGDARRLGEAATLRAHHTAMFGSAQDALDDAGTALALLTDLERPRSDDDPEWARLLSRSLNGLVLVLLALGAHELADEVSRQALSAVATGTAMDRTVHRLNRIRLQLAWGFRLERGGQDAEAVRRFAAAASNARIAARLWADAYGRSPDERPLPAEECAAIGAALALRRPGARHLERLFGLAQKAWFTQDRIMLAIATGRCLLAAGRPADAVQALRPLHVELAGSRTESALAIALHREHARTDLLVSRAGPDAMSHYAAALESELWALRESRLAALRGHRDRHRLSRAHGAATAQAMQDPLTGLPNRRALDVMLAEVAAARGGPPAAVALIDLDRFKTVNDGGSHATGDLVLREVAGCLRSMLRAQDLVARYGGDEFVVVLPATSLEVAGTALARAVAAVAALPADTAAGVTMSVGVVAMRTGCRPADALAMADAAMYRAKRAGGNTVVRGRVTTVVPAPRPAPGH